MTCAELTDSISHNFIVQMIPHHEAAIKMSGNLLKYTDWEPLVEIAKNIIGEQTKSIEDLRKILETCSVAPDCRRAVCTYQQGVKAITGEMFSQMCTTPKSCNINLDFLREMLPHHMGAVRMSNNALRYDICPALRPVLNAIITSQTKGIKEMQRLLRCFS